MRSARPEKPIASSWWRDKLAIVLGPAFGTTLSRRWEDEQSENSVRSLLGDRPP